MAYFKSVTFACLAAMLLPADQIRANAFDITSWHIQTLVGDFGGAFPRIIESTNMTVQNPYVASAAVNHLSSTAQSQYDYIWNETTGQFHVDGHLTAQSGHIYYSGTVSLIRFRANTDLLLTVLGEVNYVLPPGYNRTASAAAFLQRSDQSIIAGYNLQADLNQGDPASGTFHVNFNYVMPPLPPGQWYELVTGFALGAGYNSGPTVLSVSDGYIDFSLTSIPEPGSFTLLGFGLVALVRRRDIGQRVGADICGCGVPDIDTDRDFVMDCRDGCPLDF